MALTVGTYKKSEKGKEKCGKFLSWVNHQEEKVWKRSTFT